MRLTPTTRRLCYNSGLAWSIACRCKKVSRMTRTSVAIALAIALLALAAQAASAGGMMGAKTGDLNLDGAANSIDAALVLQADAGISPLPAGDMPMQAAADVNCDTSVNSIDASLILQADAGLYDLRT